MTFGFGTKEFEVTADRLGCYRPEDHIDNPKDYADNLDARRYDPRLRGPVNERIELAIDPKRGLKNYIASEEVGITTSAGHVRKLFSECIRLGRSYGRTRNEAELFEALRLMGTGLHCIEGMFWIYTTLMRWEICPFQHYGYQPPTRLLLALRGWKILRTSPHATILIASHMVSALVGYNKPIHKGF
jgi:Heterokaryon incompatibility protein Het-C